MIFSHAGILADVFWYEMSNHANYLELGEFVVMPNHVHGILILNNDDGQTDNPVGTTHALSLPQKTIGQQRFQNQGKNSVSSIIGSYKSAFTKHAKRLGLDFAWQPGFYDHIIHNQKSYETISNYIINNPLNWDKD